MGLNHRRNENPLKLATPLLDARGNVEGWFKFDDSYLSPEVRYTGFPPTTWVRIGGRFFEIDRAVPLKIRLLEEEEDYHFWCKKKQHSQRINCGEYHKDFGDIEVGYSFSSPQTHIWFAGYAIHADAFENIHITSHNATVRVTPEHIIPKQLHPDVAAHALRGAEAAEKLAASEPPKRFDFSQLAPSRSLFEMVVEEGADFPVYTAAVPTRRRTHKGYVTELVPTVEFINDCEREIIRRDQWDVGAAIAQTSDPVSYPPTFPPVRPFENSSLFWSFIYNQLLAKRLSRDELEQAYKDIALLNRLQQYDLEAIKHEKGYQRALDRLAYHFSKKPCMHKATWPVTDAKCEECQCVLCAKHHQNGHHRKKGRKTETPSEKVRSEKARSERVSPGSTSYEELSPRSPSVVSYSPSDDELPPPSDHHVSHAPSTHVHHHHHHSSRRRSVPGDRHRRRSRDEPRQSSYRRDSHHQSKRPSSSRRHDDRRRDEHRTSHRRKRSESAYSDHHQYSSTSADAYRSRSRELPPNRLREMQEASSRLVMACTQPCKVTDVAALSPPPALTVPLYVTAGGYRNTTKF